MIHQSIRSNDDWHIHRFSSLERDKCSLNRFAPLFGKQAVLLVILATLVIPFQLLVITIFLVLKAGHLINTDGALIFPTAANGFGIFLLKQFFQTIPIELEAAVALDGATRLQTLVRIILPLARPAMLTLFLLTLYWGMERSV